MSKNVYEMVTDRIIEQLENGVIPMVKNVLLKALPYQTMELQN